MLITGDMKWIWVIFSTRDGVADPTPEGADIETKENVSKEEIESALVYIKLIEKEYVEAPTLS